MLEKAHKIADFIIEQKYTFAMIFFSVSFSTFAFMYMAGLIPEELRSVRSDVSASTEADDDIDELVRNTPSTGNRVTAALPAGAREELPVRIRAERLGIDVPVVNPTSTGIALLDEELKRGVVRYPTSGKLGKENMLIFGHSTSIRVVNNQMYKAFNGLKDAKIGDTIIVESGTTAYIYKVFSVRLTTTEEALVEFKPGRNMLTLSTCNTFGKKEERYVVEADFVEAVALGTAQR